MKKIFKIFLLILVLCAISSCDEEMLEEPYYPEGFVEVSDYIMPFQTFFDATKGIESEYRLRNKIVLDMYSDINYTPRINPYEGRNVPIYPEYTNNFEVDFSPGEFPNKYFKVEDGYKCYCHWMMDLEFFVGAVENPETQELNFSFYRYKGGVGPSETYIPGYSNLKVSPKICIVESNGLYSYFFTGSLHTEDRNIKQYAHIFYLLYVTDDLPYDVYYNNSYLILLNKSDKFSKACIDEFIKSKEVHYFDRSKIEKYWANNRDIYPLDWFK